MSELSMVKAPRKSNFEWLRIVSMICIIAHHLAVHAVYPENLSAVNRLMQVACYVLGKLGVNCFVLISGYFLLSSRFTWRKAIRLTLTVWVYSVGLYLGVSLSGGTFRPFDFLHAFFPLIFNQYWFMTSYMIAYLLSPFLAILLRSCTQAQHRALLWLLFALASVLGTVFSVSVLSSTGWFIFLMILGAYFARYPQFFRKIKPWMAISCWAALFLVIIAVDYFLHHNMADLIHPVGLVWAILLFASFANADIPDNKVVNRLAAATLGVYLIHDNNYIRPLLWNRWFHVGFHAGSGTYILFVLSAVAIVWIVCTAIDILRGVGFTYIEKGIDALLVKMKKKGTPTDPNKSN